MDFRMFAIIAVSTILAACFILALIFTIKACNYDWLTAGNPVTVNHYKNATQVGVSYEVLESVEPVKPVSEPRDEREHYGIAEYPTYGRTLSSVLGDANAAKRSALIAENAYLCAQGTANAGSSAFPYYMMDKDGLLYTRDKTPSLGPDGTQRVLYKHTAAAGMYFGDVSDDEERISKRLSFRKRSYNSYYYVTGLYAPAGEVIKIEMSKADFEATGGITVHIGQALYNGQANNIWVAKNQMQRMPVILNTMNVDSISATYDDTRQVYTAYVGSFLGGPIYIRGARTGFSVTVSGGVPYAHFILGVTTEEEFERNRKTSAPYFDLEVWDSGVLHSGPKYYSTPFSYDDIYKAAVLWEKISLVSSQISNQGVVFMYDPFVAAGAAVAFPGRRSVNCPAGWMSGSLNYSSFVTGGAWGNMHEYNHNFQGWGFPGGGEVTNNAVNLVEYSLFTKISSARGIAGYGGSGLSGWNRYTSASWAAQQISGSRENDLSIYSTLLHNFGQDAFIKSCRRGGTDNYLTLFSENTKHDMTYFSQLVGKEMSAETAAAMQEKGYPMFVPISSVYQTGRSYMYGDEKRYITTQQPYVITYGEQFELDLSPYTVNTSNQYVRGSVLVGGRRSETDDGNFEYLPEGFSYTIKKIDSSRLKGKLTKTDDYRYTFTPRSDLESGKLIVSVELKKDDGAFEIADVDLVIEFEQSHEKNKYTLERTTYTFAEGGGYTDAVEAFESKYSGYTSVEHTDNVNPVQNCNTDIWINPPGPENTVMEVSGKIYINEAGKYRIALRGRNNCALFLSKDGGKTYSLAATVTEAYNPSTSFHTELENTYKDDTYEADSWVYFKSVLICTNTPRTGYIGMGIGQFTVPLYTSAEDENGVTHYYNASGQEVTAEEANNTEPIPPRSISYLTAYRSSYEFKKEFESDYFYTRSYNYNYIGDLENVTKNKTQLYLPENSNYRAWDDNKELYDISHLFDKDPATGIHTHNSFYLSESTPAIFTVDLGAVVTANHLYLYPNIQNSTLRRGFPSKFSLEGSLDGKSFFELGSWTNVPIPSSEKGDFTFDAAKFRYYRLTVTASNIPSSRLTLGEIELGYCLTLNGNGKNHISPDNSMFTYRGSWRTNAAQSTFGHIYIGGKDASIAFEYEGERFAVLSSTKYATDYDIYIDGEKASSDRKKTSDGGTKVSFLSKPLAKGKHKIVVKCRGTANIDSFLFY